MTFRLSCGQAARGQALVESLVAIIFLVPLMVCAIYLAALPRDGLALSVLNRELALAAIHNPAGDVSPSLRQSLQDLSVPRESLVGERLPSRLNEVVIDDAGSATEKTARLILLPALAAGVGEFDLPRWSGRSVNSKISFGSTSALGVPFDTPAALEEQLFFAVGHGAASGPTQVRNRTAALSVAGALASAVRPVNAVASVVSLVEPAFHRLCIGRIDPEIVPDDRLPASISRSSDLRYRPC